MAACRKPVSSGYSKVQYLGPVELASKNLTTAICICTRNPEVRKEQRYERSPDHVDTRAGSYTQQAQSEDLQHIEAAHPAH